jgi:hypothetical protein
VASLEGTPRIVRTLTANLSTKGLFVRMPEPLPLGTKVALSFEAGGQTLPFAEAEVVWCRVHDSQLPGRYPGFGVRFDRFLHPRAKELVRYLVENLDRGKPLVLPTTRPYRRVRYAVGAGLMGLSAMGAVALFLLPHRGEVAHAIVDQLAPVVVSQVAAPPEPAAPATPAVVAAAEPEPEPAPVAEVVAEPEPTPVAVAAAAEPEPVAAPTEPVVPAPLPPPRANEARGEVTLPTGAVRAITWAQAEREVRVEASIKHGSLKRTFMLSGPARVVFDIEGEAPLHSHTVAGAGPFIKQVRVGKQGKATRVVIDLVKWPRDVSEDGDAWVLTF